MKRNQYFDTMFRRRNVIGEAILNFFYSFSSWPRMLLETPIRTNFGERYFTFSGALILAVVLGLFPLLKYTDLRILTGLIDYEYRFNALSFLGHYLTWYAFLGYFLLAAIQRREEIKYLPSVFDFARFSQSKGDIHPWFLGRKINGEWVDLRMITTVLEPGLYFAIGLPLWFLFAQPLGMLLMICSIIYSLSYVASQQIADNLMMDEIDQIIVREEIGNVIMEGRNAANARGVSFEGRRPADPELRRRVVDALLDTEESIEPV